MQGVCKTVGNCILAFCCKMIQQLKDPKDAKADCRMLEQIGEVTDK